MNCKRCNKLILEQGISYGINPNAVCKCSNPQPESVETKISLVMPTESNLDQDLDDILMGLLTKNYHTSIDPDYGIEVIENAEEAVNEAKTAIKALYNTEEKK